MGEKGTDALAGQTQQGDFVDVLLETREEIISSGLHAGDEWLQDKRNK